MTDAFGRELAIGDSVAYISTTYTKAASQNLGIVTGFTDKKIRIETDKYHDQVLCYPRYVVLTPHLI